MTTGKLAGSRRPTSLPISIAWGSTGWNAALGHASSPYRSSQVMSKSSNRLAPILLRSYPTTEYPANGSSLSHKTRCVPRSISVNEERKYGQAARLISTSKLNVSLRFHTWPINLVVYQEPSEGLIPGRSHLVEGFTLRCIQRFSLPNVATRHCHWRDNRYTRGSSNPVLSY